MPWIHNAASEVFNFAHVGLVNNTLAFGHQRVGNVHAYSIAINGTQVSVN